MGGRGRGRSRGHVSTPSTTLRGAAQLRQTTLRRGVTQSDPYSGAMVSTGAAVQAALLEFPASPTPLVVRKQVQKRRSQAGFRPRIVEVDPNTNQTVDDSPAAAKHKRLSTVSSASGLTWSPANIASSTRYEFDVFDGDFRRPVQLPVGRRIERYAQDKENEQTLANQKEISPDGRRDDNNEHGVDQPHETETDIVSDYSESAEPVGKKRSRHKFTPSLRKENSESHLRDSSDTSTTAARISDSRQKGNFAEETPSSSRNIRNAAEGNSMRHGFRDHPLIVNKSIGIRRGKSLSISPERTPKSVYNSRQRSSRSRQSGPGQVSIDSGDPEETGRSKHISGDHSRAGNTSQRQETSVSKSKSFSRKNSRLRLTDDEHDRHQSFWFREQTPRSLEQTSSAKDRSRSNPSRSGHHSVKRADRPRSRSRYIYGSPSHYRRDHETEREQQRQHSVQKASEWLESSRPQQRETVLIGAGEGTSHGDSDSDQGRKFGSVGGARRQPSESREDSPTVSPRRKRADGEGNGGASESDMEERPTAAPQDRRRIRGGGGDESGTASLRRRKANIVSSGGASESDREERPSIVFRGRESIRGRGADKSGTASRRIEANRESSGGASESGREERPSTAARGRGRDRGASAGKSRTASLLRKEASRERSGSASGSDREERPSTASRGRGRDRGASADKSRENSGGALESDREERPFTAARGRERGRGAGRGWTYSPGKRQANRHSSGSASEGDGEKRPPTASRGRARGRGGGAGGSQTATLKSGRGRDNSINTSASDKERPTTASRGRGRGRGKGRGTCKSRTTTVKRGPDGDGSINTLRSDDEERSDSSSPGMGRGKATGADGSRILRRKESNKDSSCSAAESDREERPSTTSQGRGRGRAKGGGAAKTRAGAAAGNSSITARRRREISEAACRLKVRVEGRERQIRADHAPDVLEALDDILLSARAEPVQRYGDIDDFTMKLTKLRSAFLARADEGQPMPQNIIRNVAAVQNKVMEKVMEEKPRLLRLYKEEKRGEFKKAEQEQLRSWVQWALKREARQKPWEDPYPELPLSALG